MARLENIPELNLFELLRREIERGTKDKITEDLVAEFMDGMEARIRAEIKPLVEMISIDRIAGMRDMQEIREEFKVFIEMKGKDL